MLMFDTGIWYVLPQGSWGGEGAPMPKRKKEPVPAKSKGPARKDDKLPDVIINEKRDKKVCGSCVLLSLFLLLSVHCGDVVSYRRDACTLALSHSLSACVAVCASA